MTSLNSGLHLFPFPKILLCILALLLPPHVSHGQVVTAQSVDIAGIRLNMTVQEAYAVLRKHNSRLKFQEVRTSEFAAQGEPSARLNLLTGLYGIEAKPGSDQDDQIEGFTLIIHPLRETIISVVRYFQLAPNSTRGGVKMALNEKYGKPTADAFTARFGGNWLWAYDEAGRLHKDLQSLPAASRQGECNYIHSATGTGSWWTSYVLRGGPGLSDPITCGRYQLIANDSTGLNAEDFTPVTSLSIALTDHRAFLSVRAEVENVLRGLSSPKPKL